MKNAIEFLKGKKTYGVALVGGLYLLGCYVGWFQFDEKVCAALGIGFVATFRSALKNIFPKLEGGAELKAGTFQVDYNAIAQAMKELNGRDALSAEEIKKRMEAEESGKEDRGSGIVPAILIFGLLFFAGCKSIENATLRPNVSAATNSVSQVVTNYVAVPVRVDVPGPERFVTNVVERLLTNTVQEVLWKTNFVLRSEVADGLQTARTGAAVAGVFNPGAGAIASGALGLLSAGLGLLAARKNRDAKSANTQLKAVVKGVEQLTQFDSTMGGKAKEVIAVVSKSMGVSDELHATVKGLTTPKS